MGGFLDRFRAQHGSFGAYASGVLGLTGLPEALRRHLLEG